MVCNKLYLVKAKKNVTYALSPIQIIIKTYKIHYIYSNISISELPYLQIN